MGKEMDSVQFDILATVVISVNVFNFTVKEDGTRDIDRTSITTEKMEFKFDAFSLEHIIMRDGVPVLLIDDKNMYFGYKQGKLSSIHFETENKMWIMNNPQKFMADCKEAYIRCKISERLMSLMDLVGTKKTSYTTLDEFDVGGIEKKEYYGAHETEDYMEDEFE